MKIGKNKLIRKLRIIGGICLFVLVGTNYAQAMIYHDNILNIKNGIKYGQYYSGVYQINDFSVTTGQDPNSRIYKGLIQEFSLREYEYEYEDNLPPNMIFEIGRHKSSEVAKWFKAKISSAQNIHNQHPDMLNFAFIGTLTLKAGSVGYIFEDIVIAQGSTIVSNNWWFGGKKCNYLIEPFEPNTVICYSKKSDDGRVMRLKISLSSKNTNKLLVKEIQLN